MIDPDAKFRNKRYDQMTHEQLKEVRDSILSNGQWYSSRDEHMRALQVVDEFIRAKKGEQT